MAAQGYQESTLDQNVKSPVGAIGVMQVMPPTGKELNVGDITEIDANIHAGVKYMRFMVDRYYKDEPMDNLNKALMTFASYNAGPGRVRQLRREAKERGLDPNVWFGNVERVASERIGRETVTYVSNIFKYYVAYRLLTDQQATARCREGDRVQDHDRDITHITMIETRRYETTSPLHCLADRDVRRDQSPPPRSRRCPEIRLPSTATVTAIDAQHAPGHAQEVRRRSDPRSTASPEIKRFAEIKVGDTITAKYTENMILRVMKPGEPPSTARPVESCGRRRRQAERHGDGAAHVTAINRDRLPPSIRRVPSITLTGRPGQEVYTTKVADREALKQVKVGDRLDITFAAAVLVSADRRRNDDEENDHETNTRGMLAAP